MGQKVNGNNYDRARIAGFADAMAVMLAYTAAIEDAIEIFDKQALTPEFDAAFDILSMIARMKYTLFHGIDSMVLGCEMAETRLVLQAARDQRDFDIRETVLYQDCLNKARLFYQSIQSYDYQPRKVTLGIKPNNTVAGAATKGRVSGSGGGEVEPAREGAA